MAKSADAFRTISEVADWLGVQTHVLRFWESKFSQIKPVKRAGGRRYYRPADMLLIGGIRKLLHDDGLTIKGVQKILREEGNAYVSDMSHPLDDETDALIDGVAETPSTSDDIGIASETPREQSQLFAENVDISSPSTAEPPAETIQPAPVEAVAPQSFAPPPTETQPATDGLPDEDSSRGPVPSEAEAAETGQPAPDPSSDLAQAPQFRHKAIEDEEQPEQTGATAPSSFESTDAPEANAAIVDDSSELPGDAGSEQQPVTPPRPTIIDVPDVPEHSSFAAEPSILTKATEPRQMSRSQREALRPLVAQLTALRDHMARTRRDSH